MKIALVLGFIGSDYHGLQYVPSPNVPTVEGTLEIALFEAGFIAPSNHNDISKIGWTRSSRTDKGVHAARVVVGVKLEVDPLWVLPDQRVPGVVDAVNKCLPDNIRVFSACRVTGSFRARQQCVWR